GDGHQATRKGPKQRVPARRIQRSPGHVDGRRRSQNKSPRCDNARPAPRHPREDLSAANRVEGGERSNRQNESELEIPRPEEIHQLVSREVPGGPSTAPSYRAPKSHEHQGRKGGDERNEVGRVSLSEQRDDFSASFLGIPSDAPGNVAQGRWAQLRMI